MKPSKIGFSVIYRWRIRGGMEESFQVAWETITQALMANRGALGSRLHRAADGFWVAYAQWPSQQAWEDSRQMGSVDPDSSSVMIEAIEESLEPILLNPVIDHLVGE